MRNIFVFIGLLFVFFQVKAQISIGGSPYTYKHNLLGEIPVIEMPFLDISTIRNFELGKKSSSKTNVFAYPFSVSYTTDNCGIWVILPNGDKLWRVIIRSENAYSINLIFKNFDLPKGSKLFLYNSDKTYLLGAFTSNNNQESGDFAVSPIPGDEITLEFTLPEAINDFSGFEIVQVAHDFKNIFSFIDNTKSNLGLSGDCNVNINCPEGVFWQKEKRSICRILIGGYETCTGSLINTTLNNAKPYVLTASHCIGSSAKANTAIYYFGFESTTCDGQYGSLNKSISGSTLKAAYNTLDFSLVELASDVPQLYYPYYAGWNADGTVPISTIAIHHPSGDIKKISIDNHPPQSSDWPYTLEYDINAFWRILAWDVGTTEGGSSGGPLFDNNHRIIGSLTGGIAECGNSINDYYCKFSDSWDKYETLPEWHLKHWLDPTGSGLLTINGYDPYNELADNCFTLYNAEMYEEEYLYKYEKDWGYWTGHNSDSILQFAEMFVDTLNDTITGLYINVAKALGTDSSKVIFKIWDGTDYPEYELFSKEIPLLSLIDSSKNYIDIGPMHMFKDTFFVGYEIFYDTIDTFAVYHIADRGPTGINTFYLHNDTSWISLTDLSSDDMSFSLAIEVVSCGSIPYTNVKESYVHSVDDILLYPNPTSGIVTLKHDFSLNRNLDIRVYDMSGKKVYFDNRTIYNNSFELNLSHLKTGIYFVRINTETNNFYKKISLIK